MLLHDLLSVWLTGILFRSPVLPLKPLLAAGHGSKVTRICRTVAGELMGYLAFRSRNEGKPWILTARMRKWENLDLYFFEDRSGKIFIRTLQNKLYFTSRTVL